MTTPIPGLVSVLMPVVNEEASIEAAVASALAQTGTEVELLVIDGGSSDLTRDIVTRLAQDDPRIRLLDNPKGGISPALNIGLAAASGEFIARLDGHASVNREYLSLGVGHLRGDPGIATVGGRRVGVATTRSGKAIVLALSSPFGVGDSINHFATTVQETDHASFGVTRIEVAREVGGWDEDLLVNEDVDFDLHIAGLGYRILFDPDMVISWHVRESVRDLGRQYRRYGRGKGAMVSKNGPAAVRARHLAAPALVVSLGVSAALLGTPRRRLALAAPVTYASAVALASAWTWKKARSAGETSGACPGVLPVAFVAMHTSWGVGFLEGLAGRRPASTSQRSPSQR